MNCRPFLSLSPFRCHTLPLPLAISETEIQHTVGLHSQALLLLGAQCPPSLPHSFLGRKPDVPPLEFWAYFHLLGSSLTLREGRPYTWRSWLPAPNFLPVNHLPAREVSSPVLITPNPIPHPAQVDTPSRTGALSLIYLLQESCPELLYQSTAHRVSSIWASRRYTGSPWVGAISPLQGPRL